MANNINSPVSAPSPPSICTSSATQSGNMGLSIWNSLVDITGLGGLFNSKTPLEKLQNEVQVLKQKTQDAINKGTTQFATITNKVEKQILADVMVVNNSLQAYVDMQDEIINGRIILNNIYIFGTYFLLIVVIIFLLISNAFKK